jgi:hypothetical protein
MFAHERHIYYSVQQKENCIERTVFEKLYWKNCSEQFNAKPGKEEPNLMLEYIIEQQL